MSNKCFNLLPHRLAEEVKRIDLEAEPEPMTMTSWLHPGFPVCSGILGKLGTTFWCPEVL